MGTVRCLITKRGQQESHYKSEMITKRNGAKVVKVFKRVGPWHFSELLGGKASTLFPKLK